VGSARALSARWVAVAWVAAIAALVATLLNVPTPAAANPGLAQINAARSAVAPAVKAKKRAKQRLVTARANRAAAAAKARAAADRRSATQTEASQADEAVSAAQDTLRRAQRDLQQAKQGTPLQPLRTAVEQARAELAEAVAAAEAVRVELTQLTTRWELLAGRVDRKAERVAKRKDVLQQRRARLSAVKQRLRRVLAQVNPRNGGLLRPGTGRVNSGFGWRWGRLHAGVDFARGNGFARAAANGRVVFAGWISGYGNQVKIRHVNVGGRPFYTSYSHLAHDTVRKGQRVRVGQVVGRIGSTGYSTGVHLHFEVRRGNTPVNPMPWIT
jgi:murein DD-endopeptidase MepM/ murein hydrolase activator NlpD